MLNDLSTLREQLDRDGYVRVANVIDPVTIDTLRVRAHATLFAESAEARGATRSTGSMPTRARAPAATRNPSSVAEVPVVQWLRGRLRWPTPQPKPPQPPVQ